MPTAAISLTFSLLFAFQAPKGKEDWKTVVSKQGGFSVTVPGRSEQKTMIQESPLGPIEVLMIVAEFNGVTYIASGFKSPANVTPDKQSAYFDGVRETYATGKGKTLQKEQRGTFDGMPICYFRVATTGGDGRAVVEQARFLIGDPTSLYTLQVVIPKGVDVNEDVKRFFTSFKRFEPEAASSPSAAKKGSKKPASSPGEGVGPAVAAKWRQFSPSGKGFTVSMPGEPKYGNHDTPDGSTKIDTYSVDLGDRLYSAARFEFPAAVAKQDPGKTLDDLCKGIAEGVKGTVTELKPVKGDGLEAREMSYEFAGPDGGKPAVGRLRAFLVGSRAFIVEYNGAKGTADAAEVGKFLDSFRLSKSGPAPKAKARP